MTPKYIFEQFEPDWDHLPSYRRTILLITSNPNPFVSCFLAKFGFLNTRYKPEVNRLYAKPITGIKAMTSATFISNLGICSMTFNLTSPYIVCSMTSNLTSPLYCKLIKESIRCNQFSCLFV
ncbi:hypothetical protein Glove_198g22 [Diversispora epigaea]|uniref:Uncharacterized protein n=1 Tax=Diversispora epigaea TaxID=1348612 RepID=A0A397ITT9_9GLOM|nr:hypothetical protein Glove_198g22 [Diversispora epigaea]